MVVTMIYALAYQACCQHFSLRQGRCLTLLFPQKILYIPSIPSLGLCYFINLLCVNETYDQEREDVACISTSPSTSTDLKLIQA